MRLTKSHLIGDNAFYKATLAVALPIMFHQFISTFAQLIDNLMVGSLGEFSIAGVASSNQLFNIVNFGMMGVAGAVSIFVAQYYGAKKDEKVTQTFRIGIILCLIVAIAGYLIINLFASDLLKLFASDPRSISEGINYLRIATLSYIFVGINIAYSFSFRSIGKTKIPMYIGISAVLSNTFMNYLLITGHGGFPALGVQGAAIATLIARIIETSSYIIVSKKLATPIKTRVRDIPRFDHHLFKFVIEKSLPLACNEVLWSTGMTSLMVAYANRVDADLVSMNITMTIGNLFFVMMAGMGGAAAVIVGKKLGENKLDIAKQNAYNLIVFAGLIGFIATAGLMICSLFMPNFYDVSAEIKANSATCMRVMAVFFPLYIISATSFFILRAGGDTKSVLIMDAGYMWVIQVPIAFLIVALLDISVAQRYFLVQSLDILKAIVGVYLVSRKKWVKNLTVRKDVIDEV